MYVVKKNKEGKWILIKKGAKRAAKVFDTKAEAVTYANMKYSGEYEIQDEYKEVRKQVKKNPLLFAIIFIVLLLIIGGIIGLYFGGFLDPYLNKNPNNPTIPSTSNPTTSSNNQTGNTSKDGIVENIIYEDFQIHFLTMGDETMKSNYSEYSGDSVYIKAGANDILIDAGSRQGSAEYIKKYVDKYCTDGKLEYVIATHADQDHIAGFVGTTTAPGVFEAYEIDVLIDFVFSEKELTTASGNDTLYGKYVNGREELENSGTKCYTAAECFNEENGAQASYSLGNGISFKVLYNYYYFEESSDENNHSVCTLFTYNEKNFLLTGDLEQEGEEKLAEYYDGSTKEKTLPHCELFKAGHHGSKTSSNDCLLDKITPDICTVCCCAGSTEYTANYNNIFPTQDFITRIAKHTDRVYVTSIFNESTLEPEKLNGDIIISCDGINVGIDTTNNLTKLKDTEWFNQTVYVDADNNIVSGKGKTDFFTSQTIGCQAVKRRIWPSA